MKKQNNKKIKKGSNGMVEPNRLIRDYIIWNKKKYLNVSISLFYSCAGMVEWLSQSLDTRCPSGFLGSIPTSSAVILNFLEFNK